MKAQILKEPGGRYKVLVKGVMKGGGFSLEGAQIIAREAGATVLEYPLGKHSGDNVFTANPGFPTPTGPVPGGGPPAPVLTPIQQPTGKPPMSLDLGNLLGNLGGQYINARWGQPQQPTVQPVFDGFGIDPRTWFDSPGDTVEVKPDGTVCKKKKRRRRRRLATASDLADLQALRAVLGNGEVFKAWVATRGRR